MIREQEEVKGTNTLATESAAAVLSMPCDPCWRTPKGLAIVGPGYFGYDIPYVPIEERFEPTASPIEKS
jgi:DUF917 family protein